MISYPKTVTVLGKVKELLKRKDNCKYKKKNQKLNFCKSDKHNQQQNDENGIYNLVVLSRIYLAFGPSPY